jgi:selenide, water dikinase
VLSAAFKQGRLDPGGYAALIASTTQLNAVGGELAEVAGVHAVTDVTGFGLLGHMLELCRGSGLGGELTAEPPLLAGVEALAQAGVRTGASIHNWASYGAEVDLPRELPNWRRDLLTDPQTSGGLLIAVAPGAADTVLDLVRARGFTAAAKVGRMTKGSPRVRVG